MWPAEIYYLSVWDAVLEICDVGLGNRRNKCSKTGVSLQQTLALLQDCGQFIAMQLHLAFLLISKSIGRLSMLIMSLVKDFSCV